MAFNEWGTFNQWDGGAEPLIINASIASTSTGPFSATVYFPVNVNATTGATVTRGNAASITINGEPVTINATLSQSLTSALPASVTITPAPSEPILINAQLGSSYSQGFRANVTIGAITINIHPSTHYEIPNYY